MKKLRISLILVPILALAYAGVLIAAPNAEYFIVYYEDAAKTVPSGYKNQYCWGATWGCYTSVCSLTPHYDIDWGRLCSGGGGCDDPYDPDVCL